MNELESILNYLETTSLEPHNDYTSEFTYKDQKILWNYIKQLQQKLQQKEDIINKAKEYVINHLKQDMLSDFTGANYIQEYIEEPDGLVEILDNKGE